MPQLSKDRPRHALALLCLLCVGLTVLAAAAGWPRTEADYRNSDATWHVLLTLRAYEETPASVHHFVPLVSLGAPDDKGIAWGGTLAAADGNYYYTSFSSAGFAVPYLFFRLFRLPYTEGSLYLFNRCLLLAVLLTLLALLWQLLSGSRRRALLCACGLLLYACQPEILHGSGLVYWPQSLFQLTFLWQLLAFCNRETSKAARAGFWLLCVLNPYLEWSGYLANGGFFLAHLASRPKGQRRAALGGAVGIAAATAAAGLLYLAQLGLQLGWQGLLPVLLYRLRMRSFVRPTINIIDLLAALRHSYQYTWYLLALLGAAYVLYKWRGGRYTPALFRQRTVWFLLAVPLLENLLLMEHAIFYSFDRMKYAFLLVLLLCALLDWLLEVLARSAAALLLALVLVVCAADLHYYRSPAAGYLWAAPYRTANTALAQKLTAWREDSVMGSDVAVRGYANLTFGRGIYEWVTRDSLVEKAAKRGARYAILLHADPTLENSWNMDAYTGAEIYDREQDAWLTVLP